MSFIFLSLRANTKRLIPALSRSFHTPFAVLGSSPTTLPPTNIASQYEKQCDPRPEPTTSHSGYRTYVVSEPDASRKHYQVPAGAYPTSAPYTNVAVTDEPNTQHTATGGEQLAHGFTTRAMSHHYRGVGESSVVGTVDRMEGDGKLRQ